MPVRRDDLPEWADADRISDQIIDLARTELDRGIGPLQIFAGVMLAMLGILQSAPRERPIEMVGVEASIRLCLDSMIQGKRKNS